MTTRENDVLRTLTRSALRRHRATTTTLVLFVALAAMLASSAGVLIVTATGASSSLMTQARTPTSSRCTPARSTRSGWPPSPTRPPGWWTTPWRRC